jgi:hypothetical protein
MPIRCEKADKDELGLLDQTVKTYHPKLLAAEVQIGMVMLWDEPRGDAEPKRPIRVHGCPALARVRRLNVRDRLLTGKTITIEVDQAAWNKLTERERVALLDHELTHVVAQEIRDGVFAQHDDEHPEVKLRPDDYTINGFFEVGRRHGRDSGEVRSLEQVLGQCDDKGQLWLPFDAHVITDGGEVVRAGDRRAVSTVTLTMVPLKPGDETKSVTLTGEHFDKVVEVAGLIGQHKRRKAAAMAGG